MFHILNLRNTPILEQLKLEEALLRTDTRNWCIINTGSPDAIVMGISGKPEKLIDFKILGEKKLPLIKRFSGGGTVYVDAQTIFVSFLCNQKDSGVKLQPQSILEWSEKIYRPLFPSFEVIENDYVLSGKKFGGNAQYIQKGRFLHHTSFLWDYCPEKMSALLLPEKRPKYRSDRTHEEFLCKLSSYFSDKEAFLLHLREQIRIQLKATEVDFEIAKKCLAIPHRTSTCLIETTHS